MKKLLLLASVLFTILACSKDKFQTTPQIQIKSADPSVVPIGGKFNVVLSFTDKEGDVSDSIFIKKMRLNSRVVPTVRDSFRYKIPDFPNNSKGEFEINLDYETIKSASNPPVIQGTNPPQYESDTLIFKFAVRDKAGHVSNTVSTGKIIIIRVP